MPVESSDAVKPYYEDGAVTLFHGDCREIMPSIAWDVILTDPPYGIAHPTDYAARGRGSLAPCSDYPPVHGDGEAFDPTPFVSGPAMLFGGNYFADRLTPESGWIVWDKMRPHDLDQATAELAWTNFVKGVRVFRYLWNGMIRAGDEALTHPTQKPVALWHWVIGLKLADDPRSGLPAQALGSWPTPSANEMATLDEERLNQRRA